MFMRSLSFVLALVVADRAFAQGGVTHFCTSGQAGSHISAAGSASFTANGGSGDLVLQADHIGPTAPGLFFFGSSSIAPVPFGNGMRCVGGSVFRLPAVTPAPGSNVSTFAVDYLSGHGLAITPGSTWNFQFWFRSAGTFDLSDALQIHFTPPSELTGWSTIEQGQYTGHPLGWSSGGGVLLVDNDAEWTQLWNLHQGAIPTVPPPTVNFSQEVVVAAFGGNFSTGGYTFAIRRLGLSVATLDVATIVHAPGANCLVIFVLTQPYHFIRVPRVEHMQLGTVTHGVDVQDCP
jgi:hypothetical protein